MGTTEGQELGRTTVNSKPCMELLNVSTEPRPRPPLLEGVGEETLGAGLREGGASRPPGQHVGLPAAPAACCWGFSERQDRWEACVCVHACFCIPVYICACM